MCVCPRLVRGGCSLPASASSSRACMLGGMARGIGGVIGPMGGYLGPWMRRLTPWVAVWAGLPILHLSGPAAHRGVNAARSPGVVPLSAPLPASASSSRACVRACRHGSRDRWRDRPDGWVLGPLDAQVNPLGGSVGGVAHTPPVGPSRAGTGKGLPAKGPAACAAGPFTER